MKDVTVMTDTGKNPNKADIFYVTQYQRNNIFYTLRIKPIYPHLSVYTGVGGNHTDDTATTQFY